MIKTNITADDIKKMSKEQLDALYDRYFELCDLVYSVKFEFDHLRMELDKVDALSVHQPADDYVEFIANEQMRRKLRDVLDDHCKMQLIHSDFNLIVVTYEPDYSIVQKFMGDNNDDIQVIKSSHKHEFKYLISVHDHVFCTNDVDFIDNVKRHNRIKD